MTRCEYCQIQIAPPEEGKEAICEECKKWKVIIGQPSDNPGPPKMKPSPMAANSRGLHEKYFQDG